MNLSKLINKLRTNSYGKNLTYFLDNVLPTAIEHDIDLAIHPDDPPWPIFGIPRIIKNKDRL